MRNAIRKAIAMLDGTPTGMRGQSLVELSLTTPIFLIMLIGMVEIGWFANNYLILTDVIRSAGRFGSVRDPLEWVPGEEKTYQRLDCDVVGNGGEFTFNKLPTELVTSPPVTLPGFSMGVESQDLGYYDGVACAAIANMAPLEFKDEEDDIVVSVFGYANMPDCDPVAAGNQRCLRVTGRYPHQQNECGEDTIDPFDVDRDGQLDTFEDPIRLDNPGAVDNEGIRGYVFRGNQVTDDNEACLGSRFSTREIEQMLQTTTTLEDLEQDLDADELREIPSYGMVLVEIQWNSYQLLGLPFFSFVGDPIQVHIWGLFPVSAAEPDLDL